MVSYDITIHRSAKRELQNLPTAAQERITDTIASVAETKEPMSHEKVKPLEGQRGLIRVRVGDVRAVCELRKPALQVLSVGHRSTVYDDVDDLNERRVSG